jgi:hypothetical protein
VAVDGQVVEARRVAIASGSRPASLPISGAEHLLTSDEFLDLDELPKTMLFIGGGYISFEFAHIAVRAGAKVTILHEDDRPLPGFDQDMVKRLLDKSRRQGIDVRLDSRVEGAEMATMRLDLTVDQLRHFVPQPVQISATCLGEQRLSGRDEGMQRRSTPGQMSADRSLREDDCAAELAEEANEQETQGIGRALPNHAIRQTTYDDRHPIKRPRDRRAGAGCA